MRTVIFILSLLGAFEVMAGTSTKWPRVMVIARQNNFMGEKGHSFSEAKSSYTGGLNLVFDYNNSARLLPFIGGYYGAVDSRQDFYDDSTLVNSSFFLQSLTIEPGLYLYPLERTYGFNFFASAAGIVGYQTLALSKIITFQSLPRSSTGYSTGYRAGLGAEYMLKDMSFTSRRKWAISAEVSYKKESTLLMNQNFTLDAVMLTVGLSW